MISAFKNTFANTASPRRLGRIHLQSGPVGCHLVEMSTLFALDKPVQHCNKYKHDLLTSSFLACPLPKGVQLIHRSHVP